MASIPVKKLGSIEFRPRRIETNGGNSDICSGESEGEIKDSVPDQPGSPDLDTFILGLEKADKLKAEKM